MTAVSAPVPVDTPAGESPTDESPTDESPAGAYRPIRDYAAIGDCHGAALVSRAGGIDWCCLGRFDADPCFARLLDAETGGAFELRPTLAARTQRRYRDAGNILVTRFEVEGGCAELIDFMPVGRRPGSSAHQYTRLNAPGWLVRIVRGIEGSVPFGLHYQPIHGFLPGPPATPRISRGIAEGPGLPALHATTELFAADGAVHGGFEVRPGKSQYFILAPAPLRQLDVAAAAERMLLITTAFWREWLDYCGYDGAHRAAIERSAVALKMMTYAPTGALVAAPTMSLPETIGGSRNWDYRFCWLRDSAVAVYAMAALGFTGEARGFVEFLKARCFEPADVEPTSIQPMYSVRGEPSPAERELDGFAGYLDSLPIRIGNAARHQQQHDIYGELLDMALLYRALGGRFDDQERSSLGFLADEAARVWRLPDHGIWAIRAPPRHFVYSKVMCWVALDRAIRLFGDNGSWSRERAAIVGAIHEHGMQDGHLVQAFGAPHLDAALLIVPWLGFPLDKPVLRRTVEAIIESLRDGDYLRRYRADDGIEGQDGAFLMSSFWLIDALLLLEREREAGALFDRLLGRANDLGLFAEEIDPDSHAFLGNFPQAVVHLAVINTGMRLQLYRKGGLAALAGSHADRARRHGVRGAGGLIPWLKRTGRSRRLLGSRQSILAL